MNNIYDFNKIKDRIKTERINKKMNQQELADELNISSRQTIAKWESGQSFPQLEDMLKMCNIFDCEIGYLLGEHEEKYRKYTDIKKETGLSENSIKSLININALSKFFPGSQDDKIDVINLILEDSHNRSSFSSLLDLIAGFCQFNISSNNDALYTVDQRGITFFQHHKSLSGTGVSYDPMQAHFHLADMESMYYLKIWDSIKELKDMYNERKAPNTD